MRICLTLVLLVATFASAPVGSVEQGATGPAGGVVDALSHLAVRPSGEVRVEKRHLAPSPPDAPEHPRIVANVPRGWAVAHVRTAGPIRAGPHPAASVPAPLCERLPYDATAPPRLA